jgi:hypothetical protein
MKSRWIVHKGVEILYGDFSGFQKNVEALRAEVRAADREILGKPPGTVLTVADLTGTVTSREVVELFRQSAMATKNHVRRQAVVGVTGVQKILAQGVALFSGQSMHLFQSADQAKDWLAGGEHQGEKISADVRS